MAAAPYEIFENVSARLAGEDAAHLTIVEHLYDGGDPPDGGPDHPTRL
jgi:hypothetical protein